MKKIIVRVATPEDAEQIVELNRFMWEITYKNIFSSEIFENRKKNTQNAIESLKKSLTDKNSIYIYFVAVDNGRVVAQMSGNYKNYDGFDESIAQLGAMYILPEYQSTELSLKLAKTFAKMLNEKGIEKMITGCIAGNKFNGMHIALGGQKIKEIKKEKYENLIENFYLYNVNDILNITYTKAIDNYRNYLKQK